jgi:hypothetical protein
MMERTNQTPFLSLINLGFYVLVSLSPCCGIMKIVYISGRLDVIRLEEMSIFAT